MFRTRFLCGMRITRSLLMVLSFAIACFTYIDYLNSTGIRACFKSSFTLYVVSYTYSIVYNR